MSWEKMKTKIKHITVFLSAMFVAALAIAILLSGIVVFGASVENKVLNREVGHGECSNLMEICKGKTCGEGREKEPPVPTPSPTPEPTNANQPQINQLKPDPNWSSVLGYQQAFSQCANLCTAFQNNNCDLQYALAYCNQVVSVDLNKNGNIDSSESGNAPSGTTNCETNARCYDVIGQCTCKNLQLNLGTCISLFYQRYTAFGYSAVQALQNITQQTSGTCITPRS